MFWRKKKGPAAPPQIGCFGKLPATGDFIRLNAGGDELAAFDRWMGAGVDFARRFLGAQFESYYQPSLGLFIFRADPTGDEAPSRGMVGVWAASGDAVGRLYPMIVFASYDYDQLVRVGPALPIALWPLITAAYDLATNGRTLPVEAFLDRVARIQLPSIEDAEAVTAGYRGWLANQRMQALWETAFGTDASRYWVVQNLVASVMPFRGQELPKTGFCMRLPLGAGDAYLASVWMDMTVRLAGWKGTLLNTFWTPQRTALIHLGAPHVASFRELIAPTDTADHVQDLSSQPTVAEDAARQALGPKLSELVARTDLSLAAFLDGLSA